MTRVSSADVRNVLGRSSNGSNMKSRRRSERPESEIVREIIRALNLLPGVFVWRQNTGAVTVRNGEKTRHVRFGFKGMSDVLGWKRRDYAERVGFMYTNVSLAQTIALEVKRPGGKADPHQQAFLDLVKRDGGVAGVVTSVEEAMALLK